MNQAGRSTVLGRPNGPAGAAPDASSPRRLEPRPPSPPMKIQRRRSPASGAGFSLAELMVVIVIIGLLATLVVPNVLQNLFKGYMAKAKADITGIEQACTNYVLDNQGRWPESIQQLVTPDQNGRTYLNKEKVPTDPWGHEYQYEPPSGGQQYPTISCYGSDGVPGGEGDAADFNNHMIRNDEI